MNRTPHYICIFLLAATACFCLQVREAAAQSRHVTYSESFESFPNPERGFFQDSEVTLGEFPLTLSQLSRYRPLNVTLLNRYYYLAAHINSPIPQHLLDGLKADMSVVRQAGMKTILKFAYTRSPTNPVDAHIDIMLMHLDQLAPILQENMDVIAGMEAGFIGAWGEWAYSSHGYNDSVSVQATLISKILEALPSERMVCIRTVRHKFGIFGTAELTPGEAHTQTERSRVGFHNDGFLKSADDAGTFYLNGHPTDTLVTKRFKERETRFVLMGGETSGPSYRTNCTIGLSELRRFHYSFLNRTYHPAVLDSFELQGCWPTIDRLLGYRLVLVDGNFTSTVRSEGAVNVSLRLVNKGFAAPYNPRKAELVLRRISDGALTRFQLNTDPRFWMPLDTIRIDTTIALPPSVGAGDYAWFLNLPDPEPLLNHRPEYSIRCANLSTWESGTGFNRLNSTLTVTPSLRPLISGNVYFDQNSDGIRQGTEPGLAGWQVVIAGPSPATAFTDANGDFAFPQLGLGTHNVNLGNRSSWSRTFPLPGQEHVVEIVNDTATSTCNFGLHTPSAVPMQILPRWNILSMPVSTGGFAIDHLFPSATSGGTGFDGNYFQTDSLNNGIGYWLKFSAGHTEWIAGIPNEAETLSIRQGWNLLGALGLPVPTSAVRTDPEGVLSTTFWEYDRGYVHSDTLRPGKGYWVFADAPGTLVLDVAQLPSSARQSDPVTLSGAGTMRITSADGASRQFWFCGSDNDELVRFLRVPPTPPAGVFDARILSPRNSCVVVPEMFSGAGTELAVRIASASYPLELTWDIPPFPGGRYELFAGNDRPIILEGNGRATLNEQGAHDGLTLAWTGVSGAEARSFRLDQNYPNPFNPSTTIQYTLEEPSRVTLKVWSALGQEIATLVDEERPAGVSSVRWQADGLAAGVYFYRLRATSLINPDRSFVQSRKLSLTR